MPNRILQIVNKKFNKLTAIRYNHKDTNGNHYWLFKCDCGKEIVRNKYIVMRGYVNSCGCSHKNLGENNGMWKNGFRKEIIVGYSALHSWVRRRLLKPKICENCHKRKPYDLANRGIYDRNLKNWEWLCRKCHMIKDGRLVKLNNSFKGKKHTKEWRDCLSEKMKGNKFRLGFKHTKQTKTRIKLALMGNKNATGNKLKLCQNLEKSTKTE